MYSPDEFVMRDREIVAVSCLSADRSYAVRSNGNIFSIFKCENGGHRSKEIFKSLPENGVLQLIRSRWGNIERRFVAITVPAKELTYSLSPMSAIFISKYAQQKRMEYHSASENGFEKILDIIAQCGFDGQNILKVRAENLIYNIIGGVELEGPTVRTKETILGARGIYKFGDYYGAGLEFVSFPHQGNAQELLPEGAFYSSTCIRRLAGEEAQAIRENSMGAAAFFGHLKREKINQEEILRKQPFGLSHTVFLLDSSHRNLTRRIEDWTKDLIHRHYALARQQLDLGKVLRACLPGQGDLYPPHHYLDIDDCDGIIDTLLAGEIHE